MFDMFCVLIIVIGVSVILYNCFDGNKRLAAIMRWLAKIVQPYEPSKLSPDEMFSGVVKPSTTLAHLLVSEMLRSLDVKEERTVDYPNKSYEKTISLFTFKSFQVKLNYGYTNWGCGKKVQVPNPVPEFYLNTGEGKHPFDERELSILKEGFDKFRKLCKKREEIEKEANRQNSAVEAISAFMGGSNVPSI